MNGFKLKQAIEWDTDLWVTGKSSIVALQNDKITNNSVNKVPILMTSKCDNSTRESHNDRGTECGWMPFGPGSWLRRITYSMLPSTVSRKLQKVDIAKVSKDGGCTISWDNLWQCLVNPQWKNVQREPPVFCFLPTASILSLGTAGQSLVPSFCHSPLIYLYPLKDPSLRLLFCRLYCCSFLIIPSH